MTLRGKKGFVPIAVVDIDDWEAIRKYCSVRDVMRGEDYDCPYGGAINIWLPELIEGQQPFVKRIYPEGPKRCCDQNRQYSDS